MWDCHSSFSDLGISNIICDSCRCTCYMNYDWRLTERLRKSYVYFLLAANSDCAIRSRTFTSCWGWSRRWWMRGNEESTLLAREVSLSFFPFSALLHRWWMRGNEENTLLAREVSLSFFPFGAPPCLTRVQLLSNVSNYLSRPGTRILVWEWILWYWPLKAIKDNCERKEQNFSKNEWKFFILDHREVSDYSLNCSSKQLSIAVKILLWLWMLLTCKRCTISQL